MYVKIFLILVCYNLKFIRLGTPNLNTTKNAKVQKTLAFFVFSFPYVLPQFRFVRLHLNMVWIYPHVEGNLPIQIGDIYLSGHGQTAHPQIGDTGRYGGDQASGAEGKL